MWRGASRSRTMAGGWIPAGREPCESDPCPLWQRVFFRPMFFDNLVASRWHLSLKEHGGDWGPRWPGVSGNREDR